MRFESMGVMESWLLFSDLCLEEVCQRIQGEFRLPPFKFDCEIDSEWGESEKEGVEFNVTHLTLSKSDRLEELQHGYPDHNFLMMLTVAKDLLNAQVTNWFLDSTAMKVSQRIANVLRTEVHYKVKGRNERPGFIVTQPIW